MNKLSTATRNIGRCVELRAKWLEWQEKLDFYVSEEPKWHFIRIRGISGMSPKVQKVPQLLHLCQILSGTSVKLNKASVNTLRTVEPFVSWGAQTWRQWMGWSTRVFMAKSAKSELPWQITHWLLSLLLNLTSSAWKIWFVRSILLENASAEETTACGPFPWGAVKKMTTHFVEGGNAGNREDRSAGLPEGWTKASTIVVSEIRSVNKQRLLSN